MIKSQIQNSTSQALTLTLSSYKPTISELPCQWCLEYANFILSRER